MNPGDLVKIRFVNNDDISGHGIYLGTGKRNSRSDVHEFFWKGRIATFDTEMWTFTVVSTPFK